MGIAEPALIRFAALGRPMRVLLLLLLLSGTAPVLSAPSPVSRDLLYEEVLFYFYQGDYFSAITRLQAARRRHLLKHHQEDAELLLGGLDLSYGLEAQAGEVFSKLLDRHGDPKVRNRAWFYLAKLWHQRNEPQRAEEALLHIEGALKTPALESERQALLAEVRMLEGHFTAARKTLTNWHGPEVDNWRSYGRYNLGISLVRSGHKAEGLKVIAGLAELQGRDDEMRALRDKVNLTLGFSYLQDQQMGQAKTYLEQVRLKGLSSTKALLGMGWVAAAGGHYLQALISWNELAARNVTDSAVQESLLAIPYALSHMGRDGQAGRAYRHAIEVFQQESDHLTELKAVVQDGRIAEYLLQYNQGGGMGWLWQLQQLPPGPVSRYLFRLMAGNPFQAVIQNYRDLRFLRRNLDDWAVSIDAFDNMLMLRRETFKQRLPRIRAAYRQLDLEAAKTQRDAFHARLAAIEKNDEVLGLATSGELQMLSRLRRIKKDLTRHSALTAQRQKQHLLEGVLRWDIGQQFKARLWQLRKQLRELDRQIAQAEQHRQALLQAEQDAPRGFAGFDQHITELRQRIQMLQQRTTRAAAAQEDYLQHLVMVELDHRSRSLANYLAQARYSLARIYDKAAGTAP